MARSFSVSIIVVAIGVSTFSVRTPAQPAAAWPEFQTFYRDFYLHPPSATAYIVAFNTQTTSAREGENRNTRALDAAVRDWLLAKVF